MKFNIKSIGKIFTNENEINELKKLGFEFKKPNAKTEFFVLKEKNVEIILNNLNDLLELQKKVGDLIIEENCIKIYNDYIES